MAKQFLSGQQVSIMAPKFAGPLLSLIVLQLLLSFAESKNFPTQQRWKRANGNIQEVSEIVINSRPTDDSCTISLSNFQTWFNQSNLSKLTDQNLEEKISHLQDQLHNKARNQEEKIANRVNLYILRAESQFRNRMKQVSQQYQGLLKDSNQKLLKYQRKLEEFECVCPPNDCLQCIHPPCDCDACWKQAQQRTIQLTKVKNTNAILSQKLKQYEEIARLWILFIAKTLPQLAFESQQALQSNNITKFGISNTDTVINQILTLSNSQNYTLKEHSNKYQQLFKGVAGELVNFVNRAASQFSSAVDQRNSLYGYYSDALESLKKCNKLLKREK